MFDRDYSHLAKEVGVEEKFIFLISFNSWSYRWVWNTKFEQNNNSNQKHGTAVSNYLRSEKLVLASYERNPRVFPLFLACRMRAWRILGPAPVNSQKAVIAWEWREMALPRILLSSLSPKTTFATRTAGVKGPNLATLAMVHFGAVGWRGESATWQLGARAWLVAGRTGDAGRNAGCMVDFRFVVQVDLLFSVILEFVLLKCWIENAIMLPERTDCALYSLLGTRCTIDTGTALCPGQHESDCGQWIKSLAVPATPQNRYKHHPCRGLRTREQAALRHHCTKTSINRFVGQQAQKISFVVKTHLNFHFNSVWSTTRGKCCNLSSKCQMWVTFMSHGRTPNSSSKSCARVTLLCILISWFLRLWPLSRNTQSHRSCSLLAACTTTAFESASPYSLFCNATVPTSSIPGGSTLSAHFAKPVLCRRLTSHMANVFHGLVKPPRSNSSMDLNGARQSPGWCPGNQWPTTRHPGVESSVVLSRLTVHGCTVTSGDWISKVEARNLSTATLIKWFKGPVTPDQW